MSVLDDAEGKLKNLNVDTNVSEELVDEILLTLHELNNEYDFAIKEAEGVHEFSDNEAPPKNCEDEQLYFVHEIIEHSVSALNSNTRRWNEKELCLKFIDLQHQIKTCIKEREMIKKKNDVLERRIAIEKIKTKIINDKLAEVKIDENSNSTEVQKIIDELENMLVTQSIHPSNLLEMHLKLTKLKERIEELNQILSKYADLPPDYDEAVKILAEAKRRDTELQMLIRASLKIKGVI